MQQPQPPPTMDRKDSVASASSATSGDDYYLVGGIVGQHNGTTTASGNNDPSSSSSHHHHASASHGDNIVGDDNSNNLFVSQDYRDALEDVHTRFILNLPPSELETADRIFFQLEQAWWFYEDWICDVRSADLPPLPRFKTLKPFAQALFEYSPLLPEPSQFAAMWLEFSKYKRKISNYGCVLLNGACNKLVLVQLFNSTTYTLPSGKMNQGEDGRTAAARETYEETGFDPSCQYGVTRTWKEQEQEEETADGGNDEGEDGNNKQDNKITWNSNLRERDALVWTDDKTGKRRTCYVCADVPENFPFEPVARKEISAVGWYPVDNIPKPSFAVIPFLPALRRWIKKNRKNNANSNNKRENKTPNNKREKTPSKNNNTRDKTPNNNSNKRGGGNKNTPNNNNKSAAAASRNGSRGRAGSSRGRAGSRGRRVRESDDVVASGLASAGEWSGWSEEEMFSTNEKLLGRKIEYDGNPHVFAEQGFAGKDPHAFHVVGGTFLNAASSASSSQDGAQQQHHQKFGGIASLAPPPETSKLQPLFHRGSEDKCKDDDNNGDVGLIPFFSNHGAGGSGGGSQPEQQQQQLQQAKEPRSPPQATISHYNAGGSSTAVATTTLLPPPSIDVLPAFNSTANATPAAADAALTNDVVFLTDREITAKSQAIKTREQQQQQQQQQNTGQQQPPATQMPSFLGNRGSSTIEERRAARRLQYEADVEYIRRWVANLPKPPPSKYFGEFKLDADAIMEVANRAVAEKQQQRQQQQLEQQQQQQRLLEST